MRRHRVFLGLLAVAAVLRAVTVLGFENAIWFPDSYAYLEVALDPRPDPMRTFGYPALLWLMEPLHSVRAVVIVQHLMGLAVAVLVYALLRRPHLFRGGRGLPGWAASLAVVPVLLDGNQIELEHLLLSDTLFLLLVTGAFTLVLWTPRPRTWPTALACLLLGIATITRTIGLPLIVILLAYVLVRRAGWRPLLAGTAAAAVSLTAYMGWYKAVNGQFAMSGTDGVFLYSRTMSFADCAKFQDRLTPEMTVLCDPTPPSRRPTSHFYVWQQSQVFRLPGGTFEPYKGELGRRFAKTAIAAQPGDYLRTVAGDFARTFRWDRPVYPDPKTYSYYVFPDRDLRYWPGKEGAVAAYDWQPVATRPVEPYAGFLRGYQKVVALPGTLLGVLLLVALGGLAAAWRRCGGVSALPLGFALTLLVLPPVTVLFDYRYVLPAVPFVCFATAITLRDLLTWRQARGSAGDAPAGTREDEELAVAS